MLAHGSKHLNYVRKTVFFSFTKQEQQNKIFSMTMKNVDYSVACLSAILNTRGEKITEIAFAFAFDPLLKWKLLSILKG